MGFGAGASKNIETFDSIGRGLVKPGIANVYIQKDHEISLGVKSAEELGVKLVASPNNFHLHPS